MGPGDPSVLPQLAVQLLLIGAGHPATVVLMNRGAADLFSAFLSVALAFVDALAVGVSWTDGQHQCDGQE